MQRREFLQSATTLSALSVVDIGLPRPEAPAIIRQRAARTMVVSSSNGNWFKNGGTKICIQLAFEQITQRSDVLDAIIAGVNIDELDPAQPHHRYGRLPTAAGVLHPEASITLRPKKPARPVTT